MSNKRLLIGVIASALTLSVAIPLILKDHILPPSENKDQSTKESEIYSPQEDKTRSDAEEFMKSTIASGHGAMNGYVRYEWDEKDSDFNLNNLKESMEHRISGTKTAIDVADDPDLKKDLEHIYDLLLELEQKIDDVDKRNRLVHELQKMYRDLDYFYRQNEMHEPTNVSSYGKKITEKTQSE